MLLTKYSNISPRKALQARPNALCPLCSTPVCPSTFFFWRSKIPGQPHPHFRADPRRDEAKDSGIDWFRHNLRKARNQILTSVKFPFGSQRDGRVAEVTLLIRTVTRPGARVAPLRCPILRVGAMVLP